MNALLSGMNFPPTCLLPSNASPPFPSSEHLGNREKEKVIYIVHGIYALTKWVLKLQNFENYYFRAGVLNIFRVTDSFKGLVKAPGPLFQKNAHLINPSQDPGLRISLE